MLQNRACLNLKLIPLALLGLITMLMTQPAVSMGYNMTMPAYPDQPPINPKLADTPRFWSPPGIYQVTPNVWSAVGFGTANGVVIKGTDGLIIIDTGFNYEEGKKMMQEIRKVAPDLPVKAIIYTHGHMDHVNGGLAFTEEGQNVTVYAHDSTLAFYSGENALLGPIQAMRSAHATGALLPKEGPDRSFTGIFPEVSPGNVTFIPPTKTFSDKLDIEEAGVKLTLMHVRGETSDHINVWYPEEKVLFIGDNWYGIVPNIYSVRGSTFRDPLVQIEALDTALSLHPEFAVGSHQKPIIGSENVTNILTSTRDVLQYLRDQTIRGMNQGYTADELAQMITLPKQFQDNPYLTLSRGLVPWYVKQIYNGYLGWYEGDPAFLNATSLVDRSRNIVEGFGGVNQTLLKVREAIDKGEYQWASELATYILKGDPQNTEAKLLKAHALRAVGQRFTAMDARHWYLTTALELEGKITVDPNAVAVTSPEQLASLPIDNLLEILSTKLDPVKSNGVNKTLGLNITDSDKGYTLHVRNNVLAVTDTLPTNPDMSLTLDLDTYKSIVNGTQKVMDAVEAGTVKLVGNEADLENFVAMFDPLVVVAPVAKAE
jgi:alkyl sulfatase BDS1-like metallo-beta-lactamase superfamily hydrolase